jgi:hypothetical protein
MRLIALAFVVLTACSPAAERPSEPPQAATDATTVAPNSDLATVTAPVRGARVMSPLRIAGVAPANWYFENQFPVRLLNSQGGTIAQAPAHPRVNWTENAEPKEFDAEITFTVTAETSATLVLQEDMPREGETPREVRVPVILMPAR